MPRSIRVLLVEDSEDDALLCLRELRMGGFDPDTQRVTTLDGLDAALEASTWDIIVCDYSLPRLDAPAVLKRLRARGEELPCIVVSGTIGEESAVALMRDGAKDYVLKSNLRRLPAIITRELEEKRLRAENAQARHTLRATEESYRTFIERLPEAVAIHEDLTLLYVNPAMVQLLGATRSQEVVGRSLLDFVHEEDRATVYEHGGGEPGSSAAPRPRECRVRRVDGSLAHVELTRTRVPFGDGTAFLSTLHDVSANREIMARMVEMDRMVSVGTLAAGVGHEINNPLAYVLANLEWAASELEAIGVGPQNVFGPRLAGIVDVLREAEEGAGRIRDIVRDLKTFSRADESKELTHMHDVIDSALSMASHEVKHRASVSKQYRAVPPVLAPPSRVGQVLLNLIVNAAQAIPEGHRDENEIRLATWTDEGRVIVEVSDTGTGIPPEHLSRIYEPFFTTKPPGQGTGLGLAICKSIIVGLGGEMTVQSSSSGTTFRLSLPPAIRTEAAHAQPGPADSPRRARILYIDDERALGVALQRALRREHDVVVVETVQSALDLIGQSSAYDVIFCDLMMPEATGMDFHAAMRDRHPALLDRIVYVSGGAYTPASRAFLEEVPNQRLEKPLDVAAVRAAIAERVRRDKPSP